MTSAEDRRARRELAAQPAKNIMGNEHFVVIERRAIAPSVPGAPPQMIEVSKKHCVF